MEEIKSPRVVVVSSRLDIGGTERHLARVLPALRTHGIDVSLFVLERGGSLEEQLTHDGVSVAGPIRRGSRFLNAVSAGRKLRSYVRQE
jgi:glycosyl transferase family 4